MNSFRIIVLYLCFLVYSITLWANKDLWKEGYSIGLTLTSIVVFFLCSICTMCRTLKKDDDFDDIDTLFKQKSFKFPTFTFILCSLFPYGYTLNQLYKASQTANLPVDKYFVQMQLVIPLILLSLVLWPSFDDKVRAFDMLSLALESVDAFDMMELIPDLWYIQKYDDRWFVLFFVAMGVSALLIAFPTNEVDVDKDSKGFLMFVILKTILTLVFTDILFATIRFKVMRTQGAAEYGFSMIVKNITFGILHLCTIAVNSHRYRNM